MAKEKAPDKSGAKSWLRELDLNQRPSGYEFEVPVSRYYPVTDIITK